MVRIILLFSIETSMRPSHDLGDSSTDLTIPFQSTSHDIRPTSYACLPFRAKRLLLVNRSTAGGAFDRFVESSGLPPDRLMAITS